jgi:formylglycine-generating enzyme required for sulfatase activity
MVEFCLRLSRLTGRTYRLPSEAEWEYACRANTITAFHFGEAITPQLANYNSNFPYGGAARGIYRKQTTLVGSFPPNAFGLYDMHGNVAEWCLDQLSPEHSYGDTPRDGSAFGVAEFQNQDRMFRGGGWDDRASQCRSTTRTNRYCCSHGYSDLGFRVVMSSSSGFAR